MCYIWVQVQKAFTNKNVKKGMVIWNLLSDLKLLLFLQFKCKTRDSSVESLCLALEWHHRYSRIKSCQWHLPWLWSKHRKVFIPQQQKETQFNKLWRVSIPVWSLLQIGGHGRLSFLLKFWWSGCSSVKPENLKSVILFSWECTFYVS